MRANTRLGFAFNRGLTTSARFFRKSSGCRLFRRTLGLSVIVLGFFSVSGMQPRNLCYANPRTAESVDNRWLPWIGAWRLVSDTADGKNRDANESYMLRVDPGSDGSTVAMKASRGDTVLFDDAIVANGLSQPLKDKQCSGWYQYSWSGSGKRLLFESESSCPGEAPQKISGLSIINKNGEWLDIQLLQRREERVITIRRYAPVQPVNNAQGDSAQYGTVRIRNARVAAGTGFSVNEIIELSGKVASEILEAALVEFHEPFQINTKVLKRLADSGVSPNVVDLMVALSYPEKFIVEPSTVSIAPRRRSAQAEGGPEYDRYYYIVDPWFPWYWSPYTYSLYWYGGWDYWPGGGYYPGYPGGGYRSSGKLVKGVGYTRISPRDSSYAKHRGSGGSSAQTQRNSRSAPNASVYSQSGSSSSAPPPSSGAGSRAASPPPSASGGPASPSSGGGSPAPPPSSSGGGDSGGGGRYAKPR